METEEPLEQHVGVVTIPGYDELVRNLKERIRTAQIRASTAVNRELIHLYWSIGRDILIRREEGGWGAGVIERLSADLRREFPAMRGLSRANLQYMRAFAEAWLSEEIVQRVIGQLPWGHNITLLDKLKSTDVRLWYAQQAIDNGWTRNVLVHQIETKLHRRQGTALTNFDRALPTPQSELAQQLIKDPYTFDFLNIAADAKERELEQGLLENIRKFLLELGTGFAFLGSQYHIEVDGEDYFLDLHFYHVKLRCYVVIDLKSGPFQPEFAGKMNFYLAVVDDVLRHRDDAPSIGLILCKAKKRLTVEYALRNMTTPIGVSEYQLVERLPDSLRDSLPTAEQFERGLSDDLDATQ